MSATRIERDERTTAIEDAGYRWSYLVLSFGLLAIIALRSLRGDQASWDLLALVVVGGVVNAGYLGWHRVIYRRWVVRLAIALISAAVVAAIMVLLRRS